MGHFLLDAASGDVMKWVALGAAPGLAICVLLFYGDIYNREPKLNLILSFFLGCVAIFPAAYFENYCAGINNGTVGGLALYCYFIIAFSEEFCKFLGFRLYSYNQKAFDEPFDGIVYAVIVSMGFATVENIMYLTKFQDMSVALLRMFLSVPAHATFAVLMGYFAGKAKFDSKRSFGLLLTGLLLAIFFHGTFDFFIFYSQMPDVGQEQGNTMIAGGAIVSFIVSLILCRKLIRSDRRLSKQTYLNRNNPPTPPNA